MSSRKIICAIGAQGVGKDYLMNRLQQRLIYTHGYHQRTVRCRFADSLNEAVSAILGIDSRELQDRSLKEVKRFSFEDYDYPDTHSSRDVQKQVGQLLRENLGSHVFINALDKRYPNPKSILLISDLRMQNELDWVKRQGGKVVYIHNEAAAKAQRKRESIAQTSTTETKDGNWTCTETVTWNSGETEHYPPESELLQWDFYNKIETPNYWLDNNDFSATQPFDDFVKFVVDCLEE